MSERYDVIVVGSGAGGGVVAGELAERGRRERLGVRERNDWQTCIHTTQSGFQALGADLEPVISYTDANCMRCGSCLQGCPTNAGKSTANTYIQPAIVTSGLQVRAGCAVQRV